MNNLRQFERFPLNVPARAEIYTSDTKQIYDLGTKDISASGVFLYTPELFSNGTNMKLNLTVPNDKIKQMTGAESLLDCEGQVVRSTSYGVGIHFARDCEIMSLKGI